MNGWCAREFRLPGSVGAGLPAACSRRGRQVGDDISASFGETAGLEGVPDAVLRAQTKQRQKGLFKHVKDHFS